MSGYSIKVLAGMDQLFVPRRSALLVRANDPSGQTFSYIQGYGQLSKAGATVQLGVTGHLHIDLTVESLSHQFYEDMLKEIKNTVSRNVQDQLKEASSKKDYSSWWFAFLAGSSNAGHDSQYYRNQQCNTVTVADTKLFNSASSKMSSHKEQFHVSGDFDIVGQSYIPTTVFLFIETLTIQTSEGSSIVIPTQNTAVADAQGNTGAGTSTNKINITPLGYK